MAMYQDPDHGFTCFWRISDFNITSFDCSYESPKFKIPMLNSSTWHLELKQNRRGSLGLFLYKDFENASNIDVQMSVLTSSGWRTRFCHFFKFRSGGIGNGTEVLVDWNRHFSRKNHVLDDCLTVSCHMSNGGTWDKYEQCFIVSRMIFSDSLYHLPTVLEFNDLEPKHLVNFPTPLVVSVDNAENLLLIFAEEFAKEVVNRKCIKKETETKSTQTENTEENYFSTISGDLLKLFKDKKFQYVTLCTPSKDFAIHKALLCTKSPVFNAIFQQNRKENTGDIVHVNDVDSDTLSLLLQFLHHESLPINDLEWGAVLKLYYAADMYQVEQLKKDCCSYLKKNASDENVCDASILEDMHQDPKLQTMDENSVEIKEATSYGNWCF